MNSGNDILRAKRWHIAVPLVMLQLWPTHIVIRAYTSIPDFRVIFTNLLGSDTTVPAITKFVMHTYHYWIILPIITTGLAFLCFTKRVRSMSLPSLTLVATVLVSYALGFLLTEGMLAPMKSIVSSLTK